MANNERGAGRKPVPDGIRKQYMIPEKAVKEVDEYIKKIQKKAISIQNIKSYFNEFEAVHCKTEKEFERIINLFEMDLKYLYWGFYKHDTLLFPVHNQYGDINQNKEFKVIESEDIQQKYK